MTQAAAINRKLGQLFELNRVSAPGSVCALALTVSAVSIRSLIHAGIEMLIGVLKIVKRPAF